jgi:hypothetical protein
MNDSHPWRALVLVLTLVLVFTSAGAVASAQPTEAAANGLETALVPGTTVWITDSGGREHRVRIVGVSDGVVTAADGDEIERVRTIDVMKVSVRRSDSVINGALIGAGAAVATGLLLCSLTETWDNCRDDAGPMLRIGALGAGVGIGIDALVRGRHSVYERSAGAGQGSPSSADRGRTGAGAFSPVTHLQVSLSF